jgi:hypothetical protein
LLLLWLKLWMNVHMVVVSTVYYCTRKKGRPLHLALSFHGGPCFSYTHAMPLHRRACVLKNSWNALVGVLLS